MKLISLACRSPPAVWSVPNRPQVCGLGVGDPWPKAYPAKHPPVRFWQPPPPKLSLPQPSSLSEWQLHPSLTLLFLSYPTTKPLEKSVNLTFKMEPRTQSLLPISTTVPMLQVIISSYSDHDNSLLIAPLLLMSSLPSSSNLFSVQQSEHSYKL